MTEPGLSRLECVLIGLLLAIAVMAGLWFIPGDRIAKLSSPGTGTPNTRG